MGVLRKIRKSIQTAKFENIVDVLVLFNAGLVGLEADYGKDVPDLLRTLRFYLMIAYCVEMFLRLWSYRLIFVFRWNHLWDLALVAVAIVDLWVLEKEMRLWRLTLLRTARFLRIWGIAERDRSLRDLWLVLGGLSRARNGLIWLAVLFLLVIYTCSGVTTGLIKLGPAFDEDSADFDVQEYFGTTYRTSFTLFQMMTMDNWASSIVRPLFARDPLVAGLLMVFALLTAYGVLSVAIGVLVWSTVSAARSHINHGTNLAVTEDKELVNSLCQFLDMTMLIEGKKVLDRRMLMDMFYVPQVKEAIDKLDLPVSTADSLFTFIDKEQTGEITVETLRAGLTQLRRPTSRYDVACLTANIGGAVIFSSRLDVRCDNLIETIDETKAMLSLAFEELQQFTNTEENSKDPEVMLRKTGVIKNVPPTGKPKYTL